MDRKTDLKAVVKEGPNSFDFQMVSQPSKTK
jgi:hypothetical protein